MNQTRGFLTFDASFYIQHTQGFFPGELGVPLGGENFARPPNRPPSPLFDQTQLNFVPENFKILLLAHFSFNFDYFFAQNCIIRKLYFMLKTPKFALILL